MEDFPAARVGEAADARIAALRDELQKYRRQHEDTLTALPPRSEDPVLHALAAPSREVLHQVNAALRRLAEGRYGRCISCQRPIPAKQLKPRPYLLECLACSIPPGPPAKGS